MSSYPIWTHDQTVTVTTSAAGTLSLLTTDGDGTGPATLLGERDTGAEPSTWVIGFSHGYEYYGITWASQTPKSGILKVGNSKNGVTLTGDWGNATSIRVGNYKVATDNFLGIVTDPQKYYNVDNATTFWRLPGILDNPAPPDVRIWTFGQVVTITTPCPGKLWLLTAANGKEPSKAYLGSKIHPVGTSGRKTWVVGFSHNFFLYGIIWQGPPVPDADAQLRIGVDKTLYTVSNDWTRATTISWGQVKPDPPRNLTSYVNASTTKNVDDETTFWAELPPA